MIYSQQFRVGGSRVAVEPEITITLTEVEVKTLIRALPMAISAFGSLPDELQSTDLNQERQTLERLRLDLITIAEEVW